MAGPLVFFAAAALGSLGLATSVSGNRANDKASRTTQRRLHAQKPDKKAEADLQRIEAGAKMADLYGRAKNEQGYGLSAQEATDSQYIAGAARQDAAITAGYWRDREALDAAISDTSIQYANQKTNPLIAGATGAFNGALMGMQWESAIADFKNTQALASINANSSKYARAGLDLDKIGGGMRFKLEGAARYQTMQQATSSWYGEAGQRMIY